MQGKRLHLKVLTGTIRDEKHVFSNEVRGAVDSTNTDWLQGICEDISSQLEEFKKNVCHKISQISLFNI